MCDGVENIFTFKLIHFDTNLIIRNLINGTCHILACILNPEIFHNLHLAFFKIHSQKINSWRFFFVGMTIRSSLSLINAI